MTRIRAYRRLSATGAASTGLYCVLLVSALTLVQATQARALQVDSLPPLVEDAGEGLQQQPTTAEVAKKQQVAEEQPLVEPRKDAAGERAPQAESSVKQAVTQEEKKSASGEAASTSTSTSAPPSTTTTTTSQTLQQSSEKQAGEKDLKSLLESKNDAENDLSSPSVSGAKKVGDNGDLGAPVDALDSKPVDDRFHYSVASSSVEAKPVSGDSPASNDEDDDDADDGGDMQMEARKDSPPVGALSPVKPVDEAASRPALSPSEDSKRPEEVSVVARDERPVVVEVAPKTEQVKPETKPEQSPSTQDQVEPAKAATPIAPVASESPIKPLVPAAPAAPIDPVSSAASVVPAAPAASSASASPVEPVPSAVPLAPVVPVASAAPVAPVTSPALVASAAPVEPVAPAAPVSSAVPSFSVAPAVPTAAATQPLASDSAAPSAKKEQVAPIQPAESPKPKQENAGANSGDAKERSDKPQASDNSVQSAKSDAPQTAVVAAAAAAIGSSLANGLTGKASSTTTSTQAPPATTSTKAPSQRKSTTDKRNRWPSSSSTSSPASSSTPPARRRPILPSIRRRFRPYNRFSPFPWNGPEPYSPNFEGSEPSSQEEPFGGRPTATLKPRRRTSSSSGGESTRTGLDSDQSEPDAPSERRRPGGAASRGRHHNRNQHHRDEHDTHHQPADVAPEFSGARRRHQNKQGAGRHQYEQPFYSQTGNSPFGGRSPLAPPNFGLFNSGASSGSGFDLLNPFSWIDEVTKPIRPLHGGRQGAGHSPSHVGSHGSRPSGQPPVAYEGEYGSADESPTLGLGGLRPSESHRPNSRPGGHRPLTGGGGGRDDYYDEHHHEHHCHGHEQGGHGGHGGDYEGARPPRRPIGDRPPFVDNDKHDDYDRPYGGGGGGGRPYARPPFSRRGEEEAGGSTAEPSAPGPRITETERHSSAESLGERVKPSSSERVSASSASGVPARRIPSVFSPFDSLFGAIDDNLFGGATSLRSTFIETPLKAAADSVRHTNAAFDAIVNSPKIALPSVAEQAARNKNDDNSKELASAQLNEDIRASSLHRN